MKRSLRIELHVERDPTDPSTDIGALVEETGWETACDRDDRQLVLMLMCDVLESQRALRFVVEWGDQPWSVDVRTDLSVVLEQLPGVFQGLMVGGFTLSFFEQGLERDLAFQRKGATWDVSCSPYEGVAARSSSLLVEHELLRRMFIELRDTFDTAARCLGWSKNHAYQQWLALCR